MTRYVGPVQDFRIVLKAEREGVPPDVKLDGMYKHLGWGKSSWVFFTPAAVFDGLFVPDLLVHESNEFHLEIDAGTARSKLESLPLVQELHLKLEPVAL